jgi:hypothetical protein
MISEVGGVAAEFFATFEKINHSLWKKRGWSSMSSRHFGQEQVVGSTKIDYALVVQLAESLFTVGIER